jgi:ferredoxin-NADP reductase
VSVLTLQVRDLRRATPRTRLLCLDIGATGFRFRAGQAVMAGLHGSLLRKPYSIASAPVEAERTGVLDLLVQVDDSGGPDPHLERATRGTALDIEGPFGDFSLPPVSPGARLLLVAGGTGIAPLRSMLVQALDAGTALDTHVVYSARVAEELAYRDELERLAAEGRIGLTLTVTRDSSGWTGRRGRIDRALLAATKPTADTQCLVCGPSALVADVRAVLRELGVAPTHIFVEQYA